MWFNSLLPSFLPSFLPSLPNSLFLFFLFYGSLFLPQCVSLPPTSSPTNCMYKTIPQPSQEPASPCASGSSPQKRRFCSMTTSLLSTTSFTRYVHLSACLCCVCMYLFLLFVCLFSNGASIFAGLGWCEERLHQSRAEVLPAAEAGRAEENVHGQCLTYGQTPHSDSTTVPE